MVVSIDIKSRRRRSKSCFSCFSTFDHEDDDFLSSSRHSRATSTASDDSRKSAFRTFSGSIKSLFFKAPLVKKIRSKRHRRESSQSSSIPPSTKSKKSSIKSKDKKLTMADELFSDSGECFGDTTPDQSSLMSPSLTCASSNIVDSRSGSERMPGESTADDFQRGSTKNKLKQTVRRMGSMCNYRSICLFFICFAALVFWGKALAIITCTSAWVLSGPTYRGAPRPRLAPGNWTRPQA